MEIKSHWTAHFQKKNFGKTKVDEHALNIIGPKILRNKLLPKAKQMRTLRSA